jgi:four helix bundle protein
VPTPGSSSARAEVLHNRLIEFGEACCALLRGRYRDVERSHFAKQLVRSATSPAANYAEARFAQSRREFVQKMRVCLKELRESAVWLRLAARRSGRAAEAARLQAECAELIAIFVASVNTALRNDKGGI